MTQIDGSQDEGAVQNFRTLSSLLHRRCFAAGFMTAIKPIEINTLY
jgi:hypothetical protein